MRSAPPGPVDGDDPVGRGPPEPGHQIGEGAEGRAGRSRAAGGRARARFPGPPDRALRRGRAAPAPRAGRAAGGPCRSRAPPARGRGCPGRPVAGGRSSSSASSRGRRRPSTTTPGAKAVKASQPASGSPAATTSSPSSARARSSGSREAGFPSTMRMRAKRPDCTLIRDAERLPGRGPCAPPRRPGRPDGCSSASTTTGSWPRWSPRPTGGAMRPATARLLRGGGPALPGGGGVRAGLPGPGPPGPRPGPASGWGTTDSSWGGRFRCPGRCWRRWPDGRRRSAPEARRGFRAGTWSTSGRPSRSTTGWGGTGGGSRGRCGRPGGRCRGARLLPGKKVLNVIPASFPTKGDAVRRLLARLPPGRGAVPGGRPDGRGRVPDRGAPVVGVRVGPGRSRGAGGDSGRRRTWTRCSSACGNCAR